MDKNKYFHVFLRIGSIKKHELTIYRETITEAEKMAIEILSNGYYTKDYPMIIEGYDGSILESHS
jgi:hypothetical protein